MKFFVGFLEVFCRFFTSSLKFNEIKQFLSRGEVWEFSLGILFGNSSLGILFGNSSLGILVWEF